SICAWSSISPSANASWRVISGAMAQRYEVVRTPLAPLPAGSSALGEGAHPLAHVLRGERRAAKLDELLFDLLGELTTSGQQLLDHPLVADLRERDVGRELAREPKRLGLELLSRGD